VEGGIDGLSRPGGKCLGGRGAPRGAHAGSDKTPPVAVGFMAEDADFEVEVVDGRTEITMVGDRDAAVVVRSASGERIYLPPEDFDRPAGSDSAYQTVRDSDSPYQSVRDSDSPYQSARTAMPREGLVGTADGFRIRHPEPVTEVRLLR